MYQSGVSFNANGIIVMNSSVCKDVKRCDDVCLVILED